MGDEVVVFQQIEKIVEFVFKDFSYKLVDPQIQSLVSIMGIVFTLYIMVHGYIILAGKSDSPIKPLIWKLVVMMLFIVVATNGDGLMDAVVAAVDGLVKWAGGDVSLYKRLDTLFLTAHELAFVLYDEGNFVTGTIALLLIYLGFIIGSIPILWIIIANTVSLKLLLVVSPIMIFAYVFGWTRSVFFNWASLILSNIFVVLFVGIFFSAVAGEFESYINAAKAGADVSEFGVIATALQIIFVALVLSLMVIVAKQLAQKLATVSMEGTVQNAINKGADKFRRKKK